MSRYISAGVPYSLLLAFAMQAGLPVCAGEPLASVAPCCASQAASYTLTDPIGLTHAAQDAARPREPEAAYLGGPSVSEFRSAFPAGSSRPVENVDPATFNRYVSLNAGRGRLLTGAALAQAVAAAPIRSPCQDSLERERAREALRAPTAEEMRGLQVGDEREADTADSPSALTPDVSSGYIQGIPCDSVDPVRRALLERRARHRGQGDSLVLGPDPERHAADHTRSREEEDAEAAEHAGWFVNLFSDLRGGGSWGGDEWAAVIYVVIGVVVVGAFVIYGVQTLAELALNKDDAPLFVETGLRLSYSGKAFGDPNGNGELYRDAYLAGLRFAIGFDRPGMGIGLAAEGGYIDVFLRSLSDPTRTFDFKGGYLVAGPMVRFGHNDPWSMSLEFLNGTSNHASIGWISKSRMAVQYKVAEHLLLGGQLGAVFYDLNFFDGLGLREGNFNRDLSLVYGLETGWEF
jgi:hypothetical protein